MPEILHNERILGDFYLIKVRAGNTTAMGQLYMLRAWGDYPLLSRPISVFDTDGQTVSFLYKIVGKGTEILATLKPGGGITLDGPRGNGPPEAKGTVALVGGGVGITPPYLTAKKLKELNPDTIADIYPGFSDEALLVDLYRKMTDRVTASIGGFVTDDIDPLKYSCIVTYGPEIMMGVLCKKYKPLGAQAPVYVSTKNHMTCGIEACLVCACKTSAGNKRAYKDGPVMLGSEVFGNEWEIRNELRRRAF